MKRKLFGILSLPVIAVCLISYAWFDLPVALYCASLGSEIKNVFELITRLGKSTPYLVASAIAFLYFRFVRKNIALATVAAFLFAAVALSGLANDLIKYLVGRSRPRLLFTEGIYGFKPFSHQYFYLSFPSGHANTIAALCHGLYLVWGRFKYLYLAVAVAVLASRVVIGSHYPGDVIFGAWLAVVVTELVKAAFEKKGLWVSRSPETGPLASAEKNR